MSVFDNTLLIWRDKSGNQKYFVLPEQKIPKGLLETIRRASNVAISDTNTDEEHNDLLTIKASICDNDHDWHPQMACNYKGVLSQYERYAPIHDDIQLVIMVGIEVEDENGSALTFRSAASIVT